MRVLAAICLALAGPALAQGEYTPLPGVECYCTATDGARVEMGETICLTVDGRSFLARCEMSLNNPMWRDTGAACVGAGAAGPGGFPDRTDRGDGGGGDTG